MAHERRREVDGTDDGGSPRGERRRGRRCGAARVENGGAVMEDAV